MIPSAGREAAADNDFKQTPFRAPRRGTEFFYPLREREPPDDNDIVSHEKHSLWAIEFRTMSPLSEVVVPPDLTGKITDFLWVVRTDGHK